MSLKEFVKIATVLFDQFSGFFHFIMTATIEDHGSKIKIYMNNLSSKELIISQPQLELFNKKVSKKQPVFHKSLGEDYTTMKPNDELRFFIDSKEISDAIQNLKEIPLDKLRLDYYVANKKGKRHYEIRLYGEELLKKLYGASTED